MLQRSLTPTGFVNDPITLEQAGFDQATLIASVEYTYDLLDRIDATLLSANAAPFAMMLELANLSSIIGNLLAGGIALHSAGRLVRNSPHKYPDLLSNDPTIADLEIKIALEGNTPKGQGDCIKLGIAIVQEKRYSSPPDSV